MTHRAEGFMLGRGKISSLCLLTVILVWAASVTACDVPVHRYMLQRWERETYRTYYFYRAQEEKTDRAVNEFLEDAGSSFGSHINLVFRALDVEKLDHSSVGDEERKAWNEHRSQRLPFHLILSPRGTSLFCGRLDLPMAKALTQSPARTQMARELCSGKGGLLLVLTGSDEKESEKAGADVRWVLERAKTEHGLDVGFLRFSRNDSSEKWLVRFLLDAMGVPPGGAQSIVFAVCGRGRVLAACIGEGISRRNLVECVRIMNSDCSCDLMFEGVGMDLLSDWDWEGAVAALPPVMEPPLRSSLLGFDDSDENAAALSSTKPRDKGDLKTKSLFRNRTLTGWSMTLGVASVLIVAIGWIIVRKRGQV